MNESNSAKSLHSYIHKFLKYPSLALLLFVGISLIHTPVPGLVSYMFIGLVYSLITTVFIINKHSIFTNKIYIIFFLLLSGFVLLSMVVNTSTSAAGRSVGLLILTGVNLFMIPRLIPIQHFLFIGSRYSAILVLIGFSPYLGLNIQSNILDLSLWGARLYIYPELSPITSIFINPNAFGFLITIGAISATLEWITNRSISGVVLVGINFVGLLFTNYRTGVIALLIAIILMFVYLIGGRKLLSIAITSSITILFVTLLVVFDAISGPSIIAENDLGGRKIIWESAIQAIHNQSLFGYGLGNTGAALDQYTPSGTRGIHNSFLRMFIALGGIGGILYIVFYISTIVRSTKQAVNFQLAVIPIFLTAFFFTQMFESHSFLGISLLSVPIALIMGYSILNNNSVKILREKD